MLNFAYDTVFFDLDGTLYDTAKDIIPTIIATCEQANISPAAYEEIAPMSAYSSRHMLAAALRTSLTDERLDKLMPIFYQLYTEQAGKNARPFPGIEALIQFLEQHKIAWGIVTNKATQPTKTLLKRQHLTHRLSALVCADTLPYAKPYPDPILLACAQCHTPPNRAIFLGDAPSDIQAGNAAGVTTVACLWGYLTPDAQPESWDADFLIHHPNELLSLLNPL